MRPAYVLTAALLFMSSNLLAQQISGPPGLTQQSPARAPVYQTSPPFPPLPTAPQHQANYDAETQQANALFTAGRELESLPLYEDLCRQDPTVPLLAERHAAGLIAKYSTPSPDQKAQFNALVQAMNELHRAQALGDNSPHLRAMILVAEKTPIGAIITGIPLTASYTYQGAPAAQALMQQAEAAFAAHKFEDGAKLYAAAATKDPAFYTAALFAGDAFFESKDYANAGVWFAKAIAIDPDRETAYRYWGDALYRAGDAAGAQAQYVKAYVAEPYSIATWNALREWSAATKSPLTVPQIRRPEFYMLNGKVDFDPHIVPETGDGRASWLIYQHVRVSHGAPALVQNMPPSGGTMANGDISPTSYVHTLAEEMDAVTAMLTDVSAKLAAGTVTQEKLDSGLKLLLQIQKDDMLECLFLLNGSDLGLRHDYPKYRATHRDQLIAYVDRYLLAPPKDAAATHQDSHSQGLP